MKINVILREVKRYFSYKKRYLRLRRDHIKLRDKLNEVVKVNASLVKSNAKMSEDVKLFKAKVNQLAIIIRKKRQRELREDKKVRS